MSKFYVSSAGDEHAQLWDVYERKLDGTSQAICKCDSRESAGLAAERMNELAGQLNGLVSAAMFAIDKNLWCQRDDNIYQYRGKVWYADILRDALEGLRKEPNHAE